VRLARTRWCSRRICDEGSNEPFNVIVCNGESGASSLKTAILILSRDSVLTRNGRKNRACRAMRPPHRHWRELICRVMPVIYRLFRFASDEGFTHKSRPIVDLRY
jgi:hypothetical protein